MWRDAEYHQDRTTTKPSTSCWWAPDSSSEEEGTKTKSEEIETEESFHNLEPEQEEPAIEALASLSQSQKQELPESPAQPLRTKTLRTRPQELDNMAVKETTINLQEKLTGDQNDVSSFLQDVDLYLIMNSHIYDTNKKKNVFILSFLTDGAARTWKELFLTEKAKKEALMSVGMHEQDSKTSSKLDLQKNTYPNSES